MSTEAGMLPKQDGQLELADLLTGIQAQVQCVHWEQVITTAIEPLVAAGNVEPAYIPAVIARERMYPTGLPTLPYSVALPHADGHVLQPCVSLLTLAEPVAFAEMGTPEQTVAVRVVIVMAMLPHQQMDAIAALMQLIQREDVLDALVRATSTDELRLVWNASTADGTAKE